MKRALGRKIIPGGIQPLKHALFMLAQRQSVPQALKAPTCFSIASSRAEAITDLMAGPSLPAYRIGNRDSFVVTAG